MRAAFEFFTKLGVPYYAFHDRDLAPEGADLEETNKYLDEVVDLIESLQNQTGVKLLWGTSNLFSNPRYMNGASTNPDVHAFAYAAAQVKKMLQVTKRLNGESEISFIFCIFSIYFINMLILFKISYSGAVERYPNFNSTFQSKSVLIFQ